MELRDPHNGHFNILRMHMLTKLFTVLFFQYNTEFNPVTTSRPSVCEAYTSQLEDFIIREDLPRRKRVYEALTTIQLELVALALTKDLHLDTWGHAPSVKAPPATPIYPTAR